MTLHEAIEQVLVQEKRKMTPVEIADTLNKNSWYSKKDGSVIKSSQIGARVKKYPHLFTKSGSYISLKSRTGIKKLNYGLSKKKKSLTTGEDLRAELAVKVLMNEKNFKSAAEIDGALPDVPGLYCIRGLKNAIFEAPFCTILQEREHNIIYIGIASQSLQKRLNQELRAKGHGTFFRSLGAVLGYTPPPGSLVGMGNQNNYKFCAQDERKIIKWINDNLLVNWVPMNEGLAEVEKDLLKKYLPLLNLAGNPEALNEVSELRESCKQVARKSN